jgi:glycosyltransferase involved in cell wall biosynthesis
MNILIYFPYNQRTVEQQSVMEALVKRSHKVILLTTCRRGPLHDEVEKLGVLALDTDVDDGVGKLSFLRKNLVRLNSVVKRYDVDRVIVHQQMPALVAGLLKMLRHFPLLFVRHNSDVDYLINYKKAKRFNRVINWLTPIKIAPSEAVKNTWLAIEKVPVSGVHRINYGYNFNQYERPNPLKVQEIKRLYPAKLRVLTMARLVKGKRHEEMFQVIAKLVRDGVDCNLICLGEGELRNAFEAEIKRLSLSDVIFLPGNKRNIFDYIEASDIFLLLSESEASNSAVKEAALCKKPAIVCRDVGDFNDYVRHGENSFLVDKQEPVEDSYRILAAIAKNEIDSKGVGERFFRTVTQAFDIEQVVEKYIELLN